MSLDNYHISFMKSLYSGDTNSTNSDLNSLLFDTPSLTDRLTGQSLQQQQTQHSLERMSVPRPTSFSTLFGGGGISATSATSPLSGGIDEFSINPLGAPGTPIGNSQMSTPNGGQQAPAKNPKLYKTELCRSWMDHGRCNYGERCQYAHGEDEKRPVPRHPKYKTEACQSFHQSGYCPYGPRCHFIHNDNSSTPQPTTPVTVNGQPSPYVSQYHNMNMKQQQHTPSQVPSNVLQRVYSLPNGGYGSAGESPAGSSNDSGSESPNGSFSPGLDVDDFSIYSTSSPIKKQQPNRFLSYDQQTNFSDNQFSDMLNDLVVWNITDSLLGSTTSQKWSSEDYSTSTPSTTATSHNNNSTSNISSTSRLPVFAQLSNPQ
ncbi:unnamed protein product [Caenorhabditis angaria]|uniref:C3H1-type domain-containing protein n=1 Tax=Caenorhabditis angaria TaxID=860376 RepID=A0A9P1N5L8_9PELO|nr:unnamed protein product [Caenorhabditis angaria]